MKAIGGQAVIEGVMMKGRKGWTVAVRGPKGDIHVKRAELKELPKILKLPIMRGVIALFHALSIGIKAIEFSASKAYEDEDEKPMSAITMSLTIGLAILLGIVIFILLPLYATKLLGLVIPTVATNSFLFNLVDGIIRIFLFLAYIIAIGMWKEMRRIFEYHGAEHKVIHAYENGRELTIENVKDYSPLHPRCGTSFLIIVMVVSIFTFSFIPQEWSFMSKFLSRLILVPVIAGLSFEFLKLSSKMKGNLIMNLLIQPGLWLQRLTTREPDDSQIDVAIRALEEVLKIEEANA
ncbi:MAG: DUF1385 domain-containing protein [Nitrospirota bacterium]|nr:DUF1385 domain-containing protein [Nitrospirota bacterium]MDH5769324.1 DUF1385 domain-containing protein [Nitrospirota bacterium]